MGFKDTDNAKLIYFRETYFGRLSKWGFWRNMIVYFCVFSLIGHLMEWPYCYFGSVFFNTVAADAEVLTNPLKPFMVYGFCFIGIAIFLDPLRTRMIKRHKSTKIALLIFYIVSVFLGMAGELIQGFLQNQPVNGVYPLWDVHDYPGNILGQAWIVNDILFGIVITFATWHMYPLCEMRLSHLNEKQANRNVIIIAVIFALLIAFTYF